MHQFKYFIHPRFWILSTLHLILLVTLLSCSEGLVLEPHEPFSEQTVELPAVDASNAPPPSTPVEHIQYRIKQVGTYAMQHKTLVWPVFIVIGLLWGFIQLLRWIFVLTTSNPPVV